MFKRLFLFFVVSVLPTMAAAELSPKDILAKNRNAVVQIFVNEMFSGTGFIISKDGLVVTAGHVVTTKESGGFEYSANIKVKIPNDPAYHTARAALPLNDTSRIHDTVVLRIEVIDLPYVTLGDWNEVQDADTVTVIASLYGFGDSLIVTGIVSGKAEGVIIEKLKTYSIRKILFQVPVRGGFSGAPVFSNTTGHVIGIETSKIFGISEQLDATRKKIANTPTYSMGGVDLGGTLIEVIDNLNANLISGLGAAVDIAYAKEMQAEIDKSNNR